ncbi:hypothetical protein I317_02372 [Kwoniella heveanensis CBS 569]|uniref:BSD domain-containing protein n=1 Tax=Kwoniella heveanensis BCC8398 TaxID=1296120 RepID=A0A1B9GQP8_9TREE|nr:hypothetical protein I316_05210 [Kwoniella heveanensis BCC8398]OCF43768.1 hypothetical protein I317_02372 [Kwoniella heveanensis CBS 569]
MASSEATSTKDHTKSAGAEVRPSESAAVQAQPASPAETIHAEPAASASSTSAPNTGTASETHAQSSAASGAGNAASTVQRAFTQSLNRGNFEEEVGQVMGTLNSWWGGVKKQSASALTSLKADLDKGLTQAQADLEYLRNAKVEVVAKDPAEYAAEQEAEKAKKAAAKAAAAEEERSKSKGKGKEKAVDPEDETAGAPDAASSATAFLNRLTSSTSQLQHSLQSTLQSTLTAASNNPALSNPNVLRQQLAENLRLSSAKENLQLSMKQAEKLAEEYLKKSEGWVKDAEKWMEDAVKVVPPDEDQRMIPVSWDGSDWYSFSTSTPDNDSGAAGDVLFDSGDGKSRRSSLPSLAMASSRKDALLRRLREDKDALLVDPEGEKETDERKAEFRQWVQQHWEEQKKNGREEEEGNVGSVRMALVPEQLTDEQFWQRYLFHKHMIEAEEQKRKALLQATTQEEDTDDFNWDDEEDPTSPTTAKPSTTTLIASAPLTQESTPKVESDGKLASAVATPAVVAAISASASTSPRDSEESYDVVSDQGQTQAQTARTSASVPAAAAAAATATATPAASKSTPAPAAADDDDSDWE